MTSLCDTVCYSTIKETGYGREFYRQRFRTGGEFQRREAPPDPQSEVFVCLQENRQGHMKEEQRPGLQRLSNTRNMNVAALNR